MIALPAVGDPEVTPATGGSAGFLGFVFTFVLALALVVLVLSLRKQLRAVDRNARAAGLPTPPTAPTPPATSELNGARTPTCSDAAEPGAATSELNGARTPGCSDVVVGEGDGGGTGGDDEGGVDEGGVDEGGDGAGTGRDDEPGGSA